MKTTSELKREVKNLLGINPRDYSLRRDRGDYQITVKNPAIGLEQLKEYFKQFEHIYRCEVTHEILSGGNTFVSVEYQWDLEEREDIQQVVREVAIEVLKSNDNKWDYTFWNPWMPTNLRDLILNRASAKLGIHKDYAGHVLSTPRIDCTWLQDALNRGE